MKTPWLQLPRVQEYLLGVEVYDQLEQLFNTYQLPQERLEEMLDLTDALMYGTTSLGQVPALIEKAFGVSSQQAQEIAAYIVGHRLLPLSGFIPGVEDALVSWGAKVEDFPKERIAKLTIDDDIAGFAQRIGLDLPDTILKRFVYLAKGFITGERDDKATKTLMMRPMNIGGLALGEDQVSKVLSVLRKEFVDKPKPQEEHKEKSGSAPRAQKIVEPQMKKQKSVSQASQKNHSDKGRGRAGAQKKAVGTRARQVLPVKAVPHALSTSVPVISGHLLEHEEQELQKHKKELEKKRTHHADGFDKAVDEHVDFVCKDIEPLFASVKHTKAGVQAFVRSFLRGRLDVHRADALLQQKYTLSADQAHSIIQVMQGAYHKVHARRKEAPVVPGVDVEKKEKEVLNKRHAAMTASVSAHDIDPVMPKARVSLARSKDQELAQQEKKIDQKKIEHAQKAAKPKKAAVRLSKTSAPPTSSTPSPRVSDVKRAPVLIGPMEELGMMGIAEFRRLSTDPLEAAEKVLDIFEVLEDTDYEDRVKGVHAWRKSPLYSLYTSLVYAALLQGEKISQIATRKRNAGEESLSIAEINAIVHINQMIRF